MKVSTSLQIGSPSSIQRKRRLLAALFICPALVFSSVNNLFGQTYEAPVEVVETSNSFTKQAESQIDWEAALNQGSKPLWIWGADKDKSYKIRKKFNLNSKVASAELRASGDNKVSITINGKTIGSSNDWNAPIDKDIQKALVVGENIIEATVANEGGVAAFVAAIIGKDSSGKDIRIVSDESWQIIDGNATVQPTRIATHGDQPWGSVLTAAADKSLSVFQVQPGFEVERLFTVPKDKLGSWVALTVDPKGRLIASDQGELGLVRITPSPIGSDEPTKIEKLNVDISSAQGLLFAFDSLYVTVNGKGNGLYRLRDTDGDDQFDKVEKIAEFRGGGEHGPHALRLSPDGKSIVVAAGNHTLFPADRELKTPIERMGGMREKPFRVDLPENMTSRIAPVWDEDILHTRLWDANGHATGIYAPGGWMAQCDPEGKKWEVLSIGYRNQYDFDYNADGEMFVYDSDMEWDMGTPWYRPTRVVHASSGSEFGWRSGTACWPTYYIDSLPSLSDIGPGSPVGVTFGYGAKFPAKYQKALYILDWTFGTVYALHLEPDGSTYKATKEEFLSRSPLPLTDAVVGSDGAFYFTVGGRGAQSELYRVTYTGEESTAAVDPRNEEGQKDRALRHEIEKWHKEYQDGSNPPIAMLVSSLGHKDLYIRNAARTALERVPLSKWWNQAKANNSIDGVLQAVVGATKIAEKSEQGELIAALGQIDWAKLSVQQQLDVARAYQLVLIRLGKLDDAAAEKLAARVEAWFPAKDNSVNRELATLLVGLNAKSAPAKIVPLLSVATSASENVTQSLLERNKGYGSSIAQMMNNQPDMQQIHYALILREQQAGWTFDLRKAYFEWFPKAQKWSGGNSYQKFLVNISNDAFASAGDKDRLALEALGLRTPAPTPAELPKAKGPGKEYTTEEVAALTQAGLKDRDFENGRKMYAAARCVVCHRFAGEGGATGPDLTQVAGRFNAKDLAEAIVDPSKVISDLYKTVVISTEDGNYTGRIISENATELLLLTDPEDSTKTVTIAKEDIIGQKTSEISVMPKDLLNTLNQEEVLDLMAYLLTRGDANSPVFKKK